MKTYDEQLAQLGRAVRSDNQTEAMNIAFGILADVLNTFERIAVALEKGSEDAVEIEGPSAGGDKH